MVGTCGNAANRVLLATANPRRLPSFTCATVLAGEPKAMGVWPPRVEAMAGPAPLNGMWMRSSPGCGRAQP
jgi:hypothetical protein